jgi:hypothetical protein
MFKVGDKVQWESQAAGFLKKKQGEIFRVITKWEAPMPGDFPDHKTMFDGDGMARGHYSYLVEVPGGKTDKATPKLYWPRVKNLKPLI